MKKVLLFFVRFATCGILYGFSLSVDEKEKEAVRVPLENYLKGHETGVHEESLPYRRQVGFSFVTANTQPEHLRNTSQE